MRHVFLRSCLMMWAGAFGLACASVASAGEKTSAERGWDAMISRTFAPPIWSARAYESAWKQWGVSEKPSDYDRAFTERYGLHAAPFENKGLPMGLRKTLGPLGVGVTNDCLLCHAGSIAGQTVIGLGNASVDMQSLYDDLFAADSLAMNWPFKFANVRGTFEAGALVTYLMEFRDADLKIQQQPLKLGYRDDLCEDIPAWWNLKKKQTMYHTGGSDVRSVRSIMTFLLSPMNSADYIKKQESVFTDIHAWLLTLEPPKYPFPIDEPHAARGKEVFRQNCVRCHGTYGPDGKYPNKHVPLEEIGTDPALAAGFTPEFSEHFVKSWFAQEKGSDGEPYLKSQEGYQAPPLDGIWATAPYLHNGSVPTVYHMLNSKARPKVFTRSYGTKKEDYDPEKLGWRITVLDESPDPGLSTFERNKIYDTAQPGRGNGGHPFGDQLTEHERMAVLEYLKTL